jgi:hypothetical protein
MMILLLAAYSAVVSIALIALYRSRAAVDPLLQQAAALAVAPGSLSERAEALKAVAEIRRNQVRWFEQAISSIGVFALITMTVGTAVQTIRSTVQEREVKEWEHRSADVEQRIAEADSLIAAVANTVIAKASRVAVLSQDERKILRYRLQRLSERPTLDAADRDEMISASIALREFSTSVSLINRQPSLFDEAAPADQVSLAEYYYLTGDQDRGRTLADRATVHRHELQPQTQMRLIVIRLLLGQFGRPDAIREAAAALRLDTLQAEAYLTADAAAFAEGAKRLRATR